MSLYGVISYRVTLSEGHMIANHPIYGVTGYHVTLSITPLAIMLLSQRVTW